MAFLAIGLIEKILHKTPAESLLRFKPTCKEWYDLINDKKFMYKHFDHSPERFIRANDDGGTVHDFDPVTRIHSVSPMPSEFRLEDPIYKMVHCDGLILCVRTAVQYRQTGFRHRDDWKLAIWNPVLRKIKWIEPEIHFCLDDHFGIGYDKKSRDNYKILRISWRRFHRDDDDNDAKCKIYEFTKSDSWRTIEAKSDGDLRTEGVSVKGSMYWIVERDMMSLSIISFDFSTETFKDICVCPNYWDIHLGCFNRDGLSLFLRNHPKEIYVWVTNKLSDEIVSFTQYFYAVLLRPHYHMHLPVYSLVKHKKTLSWGELSVREDGEWSTWITRYNILKRWERISSETERLDLAYYCDTETRSYVYVPSLIPVPT